MSSLGLYELFIAVVSLERCLELLVSRRNRRWILARGGIEHGRGHYPIMVVLHAGFLAAAAAEPPMFGRPFIAATGCPALALALACQAMRWWCVRTLRFRWNTRIFVLGGVPLVSTGPYRWMRHPNYVAVATEGVALPLVHGAWVTALCFTAANALLLRQRIRCEEAALGLSRCEVPSRATSCDGSCAPSPPRGTLRAPVAGSASG